MVGDEAARNPYESGPREKQSPVHDLPEGLDIEVPLPQLDALREGVRIVPLQNRDTTLRD
jgi:hypothetical protein